VFYRGNKILIGTSSGAYKLKHECPSTSDLITCTKWVHTIYFRDKTRIQHSMFNVIYMGTRCHTHCL